MYHVSSVVQCIYGCSGEGHEDGDGKEGNDSWRMGQNADDLSLCGESEEELRAMMVRRFAEVYRRRELKVNAGKSKVMVLNE